MYPLKEWSSKPCLCLSPWQVSIVCWQGQEYFETLQLEFLWWMKYPLCYLVFLSNNKVLETVFSPLIIDENASWKEMVWIICTEAEFNTAMRAGCKGKRITIHFFTSSLTTLALIIHRWDQHLNPESDKTLTVVSKAKILFTLWNPSDFWGAIYTWRMSRFKRDTKLQPLQKWTESFSSAALGWEYSYQQLAEKVKTKTKYLDRITPLTSYLSSMLGS